MHSWYVCHHSAGREAVLCDVPVWAVVVSHLADLVDGHLGHVLCGQGLPEVFSHIPLGWPEYDVDNGVLANSVAYRLHRLFGEALCLPDRRARVLRRVKISKMSSASSHPSRKLNIRIVLVAPHYQDFLFQERIHFDLELLYLLL
jgi:hypothetical protein